MFLQVILGLSALGAVLSFPDPQQTQTASDRPIVTTSLGQIQGSLLTTRKGKQIFAFRGIRYAKAPVNDLRFRPPVAAEKWENVLNATQDGPLCPQQTTEVTSEDCLFLNVYTTKLPQPNQPSQTPKRPVLVYIHGGNLYSEGATSTYLGPQYLLDQDIVLVTFNYRLGSLGFLSTGDKEAPGNNGLKDQVLALKWIKKHIASFNGDTESVTLVGYNAGALSVTLHLVSPLSQNLFHRAIAMSGSALGQFPLATNQLDLAKKQANLVGCSEDGTTANIVKCLRSKSAQQLADHVEKFAEIGQDPVLIWSPVIEGDFGQERFLTAHPIELIQSGQFNKVPVVFGVTTDEFASRAFNLLSDEKLTREFCDNWPKYAPISFIYERNTDNSKSVSQALKTFYLNDKQISNASLPGLIQLYADSLVGFGVNRAVKLLSEKSGKPVFYYRFSYKGRYSHYYLPDSNNTIPFGVVHQDDLIYLFFVQRKFPLIKESDPESQTIEKLTLLWTNFARTGNPVPETTDKLDNVKWESFNGKTQKYLDIGNKLVVAEKLNEKRYAEWEKLFPLDKYTNKKHSG